VVDRMIEAARTGSSDVLVVRGEAGVGKSALLDHAAATEGMTVLRATGVEAESELSYAALHQLLHPVLGHATQIPAPQSAALRGAFGLHDGQPERFRVALAVLSLLAEAAEERPLLCLVDDAQWLDRPSTDALLFCARRLEAEGVVLLFAARDGEPPSFDAPGLAELRLAGLPDDAAAELLAACAPAGLAPAVRDELVRLTRGNPLALTELPGALDPAQLAGRRSLSDPLPLTRAVEQAYLRRVRLLPPDTQALLDVAAAEDAGDVAAVLAAAAVLGHPAEALDEAERAGLVAVTADGLTFRHPLVRSAIYGAATYSRRRSVHRALADVLDTDEQRDRRAWHRAAAVIGTDESAAVELGTRGAAGSRPRSTRHRRRRPGARRRADPRGRNAGRSVARRCRRVPGRRFARPDGRAARRRCAARPRPRAPGRRRLPACSPRAGLRRAGTGLRAPGARDRRGGAGGPRAGGADARDRRPGGCGRPGPSSAARGGGTGRAAGAPRTARRRSTRSGSAGCAPS